MIPCIRPRRPLWPAAVLVVLLLASGPVAARPLRFTTIDTPPWAWIDPANGRATGLFPALVADLGRRLGSPVSITLAPFARVPHDLQQGRADCTILVWNPAWSAFLLRGERVVSHHFGVIARKGVPLRGTGDLRGLRISVLRGLDLGRPLSGDPAIRVRHDTDYRTGLEMMRLGRLDAVAGALPTLRYLARQAGMEALLGETLPLATVPLPLQCAKTSPAIGRMPALNAAIAAMRRDGTIDHLSRDYGYE